MNSRSTIYRLNAKFDIIKCQRLKSLEFGMAYFTIFFLQALIIRNQYPHRFPKLFDFLFCPSFLKSLNSYCFDYSKL